MKNLIACLLTIISISTAAQAQDFSGHYQIDSKEMIDGKEYLNAIAQELTVKQTKDSFLITRITPAGNETTTTSNESLPLNGKPVTIITGSKRTKISSVIFNKTDNSATLTTTFSYPEKPGEVEFKNTETWKLEKDGTLTITKNSDAAVTDDWTIKAIFKKS